MTLPPPVSFAEAELLKREGLDSVAGAFACETGERLDKPGLGARCRIRLDLADESGRTHRWYLKRYGPEPWPHRLRRWLAGRRQSSPARRELRNIRLVSAAGVPTMRALAFGQDGRLLGARRSYVVVTAVAGEALERCLDDFMARWDSTAMGRFNAALVALVRRLHAAGAVHRDLYAAHVFLDATADGPRLYLIDLARVFVPRWRRFRWRVKDLAQLKYSMPPEWVRRHWGAFLDGYLEGAAGSRQRWARAIDRKVAGMVRRRGGSARGGRAGE